MLRAPRRAYEEVANELEVLIRSGHFAVDERLPSERQLAAEFGVSRPTIRVALGQLEARGYVVTRANSGTFVAARTVETIDVSSDEDPQQVMEARLVLEVAAARLAARRAAANPEALEDVRLALEAHERITDPEMLHPQTDAAFHRAIAGVTGNAYLCEMLEPLWRTIDQNLGKTLLRRSWTRETFTRAREEHRAIYEALAAGDPDLAAFRTEAHLRTLSALMFET
jgi:DNA-binding FadR family transcriptional regulator